MSLVLRYPFDGVTDNVTPANTAQPVYGSGVRMVDNEVFGNVAQFDGGSNAYVTGPSFTHNTASSVCYWINARSKTQFVHGVGPWGRNDTGSRSSIITSQGNIRFTLNREFVQTSLSDSWTHVCEIYDGSNQMVYVDGVLKKTQKIPAFVPKKYILYVGKNETFRNLTYAGKMSDFRIYDYALDAGVINKLYSDGANYEQKTEIRGTLVVKSKGSTHISLLVEGDPNVDYHVVVADQVVYNVKTGDTVTVRELKPKTNYDCELFKA